MKLMEKCLGHKDSKNKIANCISITTIVVGLFLMGLFGFWFLYPYEPLVLNERPVMLQSKEIPSDGYIAYELDYCKKMDLPVTIRRKLKDGIIWALPDVVTNNNKVGCRRQTFAIPVPHSLPEGEYIMSIEFVYEVNPIREVIVSTHTEKFEVKK